MLRFITFFNERSEIKQLYLKYCGAVINGKQKRCKYKNT